MIERNNNVIHRYRDNVNTTHTRITLGLIMESLLLGITLFGFYLVTAIVAILLEI